MATVVQDMFVRALNDATSKPGCDESPTLDDGIHRRRQFTPRIRLADIASRARAECGFRDLPRLVLADEEDFDVRIACEDSARCFDAIHHRKADVEQNQIGSKIGGFLNGIGPIGGLADDPPTRTLSECRSDVATPRLEIVDNQDPVAHYRLPSGCGRRTRCALVSIKTRTGV